MKEIFGINHVGIRVTDLEKARKDTVAYVENTTRTWQLALLKIQYNNQLILTLALSHLRNRVVRYMQVT